MTDHADLIARLDRADLYEGSGEGSDLPEEAADALRELTVKLDEANAMRIRLLNEKLAGEWGQELDNVGRLAAALALPEVRELVEAVERLNAACDAMWNDRNRVEKSDGAFGYTHRIREAHVIAISEAQQQLPAALTALEGRT